MAINSFLDFAESKDPAEVFSQFSSLDWSTWASGLMNAKLGEIISNPTFSMDFKSASANQFLLHRAKTYFISLNSLQISAEKEAYFDSSSRHMFIHVLGQGTVTLKVHKLPEGYVNEIFDRDLPLAFDGFRTLKTGESYWINPDKEVVTFDEVEGSAVTLHLVFDKALPLVWHFDSQDLRPIECSAGDADASRSEFCLQMLAELPPESISEEAWEALDGMSSSPHHFLRWEAVRAMLALDPLRGKRLVESLLQDPHPHVREAATETINLFNT